MKVTITMKAYGKAMLPLDRMPCVDRWLIKLGVPEPLMYKDGSYLLPWTWGLVFKNLGWWTVVEALNHEGFEVEVNAQALTKNEIDLRKNLCCDACSGANPDTWKKCSCKCGRTGSDHHDLYHGSRRRGEYFWRNHFTLMETEEGIDYWARTYPPAPTGLPTLIDAIEDHLVRSGKLEERRNLLRQESLGNVSGYYVNHFRIDGHNDAMVLDIGDGTIIPIRFSSNGLKNYLLNHDLQRGDRVDLIADKTCPSNYPNYFILKVEMVMSVSTDFSVPEGMPF